MMLKIQYYIKLKRKLNFINPQRFTEKLQVYKTKYRNPAVRQCIDKYRVREFIESKGLTNIINTLYGVYDNYDEIQIKNLPDQFIVKTTNGGGGINIFICKDKSKFDFNILRENFDKWLVPKKISGGREWAYTNQKPKIIVEKLLINEKNPEAGITDYKFFCFSGNPEFLVVDVDRYTKHKRNFYDINWNYLEISSDCPNFGDTLKKPEGLNEMVRVAKKLSEDFPFVRVDLYYVEDKVIFGEMTFYPWSGYVQFEPDSFDFVLGNKFDISNLKNKVENT